MVRAHPTVPPQLKYPAVFSNLLIDLTYLRRLKYKRRIQMALRMVALNRLTDGRWFARKGIPGDVRDEYARLYGVRGKRNSSCRRTPRITRQRRVWVSGRRRLKLASPRCAPS